MTYDPQLTVTRAAKYLGVSGRQVRRYCHAGVIDAHHIGAQTAWQIPLSELVRLRPIGPADPRALEGVDMSGLSDPASLANRTTEDAEQGTIGS